MLVNVMYSIRSTISPYKPNTVSLPYLNRWIQPDSIIPDPGISQAWNRFSYVNINPVRYNDPTGHYLCEGLDCSGGPGAGSGGTVGGGGGLPGPTDLPGDRKEKNEEDGGRYGGIQEGPGELLLPEEVGWITEQILASFGTSDDWNTAATTFDILAWLTDFYAAGVVTYAGFYGAGLTSPFIAAGLPEVPMVTGLAGMAIAELIVQPVLMIGNMFATTSTIFTVVAETKIGTTRIEDGIFSDTVVNSATLTGIG